ncbi:hypothetical protein ACFVBP_24540, partial [Nocardioides sp. NPDC057764]|uniref:hypothetical protein n=1 Tax=Nocardioides sp. NPDC057764 TaxID=3346243 RepID=UPI00366EDC54
MVELVETPVVELVETPVVELVETTLEETSLRYCFFVSGFAADPFFECFSIGHRVKDGLRPPLRGGLRPSLTRHPIEKDFAYI